MTGDDNGIFSGGVLSCVFPQEESDAEQSDGESGDGKISVGLAHGRPHPENVALLQYG
jgi:hypothetical protein